MCGRFVSASPPDQIARYFDAVDDGEHALEPNYNVAPTADVYAVLVDGGVRRLETLHWGLVPFWAKSPSAGYKMINARAETVATKNAYRKAFRRKRCIIPADGFYEWQRRPEGRLAYAVRRRDGRPMAFAGLWEVWRNPDKPDEELHSCTVITGEANEKMAAVHDRMPVMLPPSAWDTWLDPQVDDVDLLGKFLVPAPPELIELRPVSTEVNSVRNRGPHLLERVDPADALPLDG